MITPRDVYGREIELLPGGAEVLKLDPPPQTPRAAPTTLPPLRAPPPGTGGSVSAPSLLYHADPSPLRDTLLRSGDPDPPQLWMRPPTSSPIDPFGRPGTRAARPSTRGSKVWWSSGRAIDELYETWTFEDSWHRHQRMLQLNHMRMKRQDSADQSLYRKELYPCKKLRAQKAAEALQRVVRDSEAAPVRFLPELPAARSIAKVCPASTMSTTSDHL